MEKWVSGIMGAIIGYIISLLTLRFNYKQLYAQTVSSTREKWLCIFRENLSKFLACAEVLNKWNCTNQNCSNKEKCKYEKEFYESRGMLVSRLNLEEELHVLMFSAINQIDYEKPCAEFIAKRDAVYEIARNLMKEEWECVKDEARGKNK